ncbi:MAG: methyltransferase domain-containing protein [Hyphomicrobiaceae bacterium]
MIRSIAALETRMTSAIRANPGMKALAKSALSAVGYDTTDWLRVVMYRECFDFIRSKDPASLDTFEISGGPQWRREFTFKSYTTLQYPDFDICAQALPKTYDLIIADQVFEHLEWPLRAARNVYKMLAPGGYAIIAVPFLVRVHASPLDCSRWTETGLSRLLQEAGFSASLIESRSWGNRSCLIANLAGWRKRGFFGSLKNEPNFPVMTWAYAGKEAAA